MGDVERILTISQGQQDAIQEMINALVQQIGSGLPASLDATKPLMATGQDASWKRVISYANGSQTAREPEGQVLYDLAVRILKLGAEKLKTPWSLSELNDNANSYSPMISQVLTDVAVMDSQTLTEVTTMDSQTLTERATMDSQTLAGVASMDSQILTEVALTEADWNQTYFDEWIEDPAWDFFNNITAPAILEEFAGSNPRWSGRANRAVTEARRKLTLEILSKRGETAVSFMQFVAQMKDKQLDRKTGLTGDRDKTNASFEDKQLDRSTNLTADLDKTNASFDDKRIDRLTGLTADLDKTNATLADKQLDRKINFTADLDKMNATFEDKQIDRKTNLTADRDKTNATLYDKNTDRMMNVRESFLERVIKYQNESIDRQLSSIQGFTYFIEQPLNNYLKRAMAGMQSGELQRGITGQSDMVEFQNKMRRHWLMNPAIEFLLAVCGQPMYTAVAEQGDQSPWGAIAQGAFGMAGSLLGNPSLFKT